MIPGMPAIALTPYVATLFRPVEDALREVLGLGPEVRVTHRTTRRPPGVVDFRVEPPNGLSFEMKVARPGALPRAWREAGHLWLAYEHPPDRDPLHDPTAAPSLDAIGKRFVAQGKKRGDALAARLWEVYEPLAPWAEISDEYYRRVFYGVVGASANLRLGFRCNQDCGFCWQSRAWPEPPTGMYRTWLEEIAAAGVRQLIVTGGEPTLRKGLPALLGRAHELGMATMVQTNAVQLAKPEVLARLVEARANRLFVSFHAADPDISDGMTRAPGTHRRTVAGITAALKAGIRVGLNCVVERANHRDLPAHAAFIAEHFVRAIPTNPVESVTYSRPQTYHDRELWRERLVPLDEIEPFLLRAVETLRTVGVLLDVTTGSCGLPACLLRAHPGLIFLPEPEHVGMADPTYRSHARDGTACGRCALVDRCQGPGQGYFELHGDRGLVPFDALPAMAATFPLSLAAPVG